MELLELTMMNSDFWLAALEVFLRVLAYGAALTTAVAAIIYALILTREATALKPARVRPTRLSAPRRRR